MPEELKTDAPETPAAEENVLEGGKTTEKEPGDGENGGGKQEPEEPGTGTEGIEPKPKEGADKNKEVNPDNADKDDYGEFNLPKEVKPDKEGMDSFKALAKELGISKENAQKLVDIQTGMAVKAAKAQQDEFARFQEDLKEQCKAKFGDKLDGMLSDAAKALDRFGGDELRKTLDDFGLGNHPALVEAFAKIGREIGEDKAVLAKQNTSNDVTFEEAMYGKK